MGIGGAWAASSIYSAAPWPEAAAFISAHPVAASYGQVWTRRLPAGAYKFEDAGAGEAPPGTWTRTFPHPLTSPSGQADRAFVNAWEHSPWSDRYLADLAASIVAARGFGRHDGTDVLAVGFSGLDLVGHAFGPRSHEVQDLLVQLDGTIGDLLDRLDRTVGRDKYVVALSADHGVATLPEQARAQGQDAGRFSASSVRLAAEAALVKAFGPGTYVRNVSAPDIYFAPGIAGRLAADADARTAITRALQAVPGVGRVAWARELTGSHDDHGDPILESMRAGFMPDRSGDLLFVPKPNWIPVASGTSHGSPYAYDTRVPVVLFGAGIAPGRYTDPATPADLAPTLAALLGISMPQAQGHVLEAALAR